MNDVHVTEHITGRRVEAQAGRSAQAVVDTVVEQLGLPRRTEGGEVIPYSLRIGQQRLEASHPVTDDAELDSELGREVYGRVASTLDEIEAALDSDEPAIHLSTRLSVARRTGALPQRVDEIQKAFDAQAFPAAATAAPTRRRPKYLRPAIGLGLLLGFFVWLFWVTEPGTANLAAGQESDAEVTHLQGAAEVQGTISANGEVDRYTFDAAEGDFVTVSLLSNVGQFGNFDAELSVDGPDGSQVAYNDDFNNLNSQVSFEVVEQGTYTILARALGGCCVGDYVLVLEFSN